MKCSFLYPQTNRTSFSFPPFFPPGEVSRERCDGCIGEWHASKHESTKSISLPLIRCLERLTLGPVASQSRKNVARSCADHTSRRPPIAVIYATPRTNQEPGDVSRRGDMRTVEIVTREPKALT